MLTRAGLAITLLFSSIALQAQMPASNHSLMNSNSQVNLSVTVQMADGQPAANARVELRSMGFAGASATGYTNSAGIALLPNVPGGSYEMVVTHKLTEVQQRTTLSFGEQSVNVRLPMDATGQGIGSAASVSVAAYKVPDKARKEFKKAQETLAKGNQDDCLSHLNKALEMYSAYSEALSLRGIIRMDRNDREGALADLDAAIKADSSNPLAYFAMGAALNAVERYDDAARTLQRGLTLEPNSWQGYFEMGKALVGKGDYKAAIEQLDKAQSFATSKYPPIHLVKAHAMLATKQYPGAMKELQDFLAEAPNDSRSANAKETLDRVSAFVAQGTVASK
jgi:predicted Zn-dependent protease